jgi:uncharacterized protein
MTMNNKLKKIQVQILPILHRYDVVKAGIFGSFAAGDFHSNSDLDLLVEFQGRKSLLDLVGLKLDLEDILHRPVDVVTYRSIYPKLKKRILKQEIRIL